MRKIFSILIFNCTFIVASSQNVGIGTTSPTQKLDVVGNLRVSGAFMPGGQAGSAGQVLTSNGTGNAPTWENITADGGKFWMTISNNSKTANTNTGRALWDLESGTAQEDSLDYFGSVETGSDFTISNSGLVSNYITLNRSGLYHFEGLIRYFLTVENDLSILPRITLKFKAIRPSGTDPEVYVEEGIMSQTGNASTGAPVKQFNGTARFTLDIYLEANTTFTFLTGFNNLRLSASEPLVAIGVSSGGYISGHFISE